MINRLTEILHGEQCSCVISNSGIIRTFRRRGIADLFITLKNEPKLLCGALVADKVVGKAAAALLILGGADHIYADIISTPALAMLREHGITVEFETETDHILNRTGTGWCPMEQLCHNEHQPETIKDKLEQFLRGRNGSCSISTTKTKTCTKYQTPCGIK